MFLPVLSEHFLIPTCRTNGADIQMSCFVSGDSDAAPWRRSEKKLIASSWAAYITFILLLLYPSLSYSSLIYALINLATVMNVLG